MSNGELKALIAKEVPLGGSRGEVNERDLISGSKNYSNDSFKRRGTIDQLFKDEDNAKIFCISHVLSDSYYLSSDLTGQDINGNPLPHFLFPSFIEGIVIMKDGVKFPAMLNYNMVEEKMVTELDGTYRYSTNPHLIESIVIEDRVFVPVKNAFYEILSAGMATFFLQHKSYFVPRGNDIGYGSKSQATGPVQYKRFELSGDVVYLDLPPDVDISPASVFWVYNNGNLQKFNTMKQFLKIFPGYEAQLKEYIKKENIKHPDS